MEIEILEEILGRDWGYYGNGKENKGVKFAEWETLTNGNELKLLGGHMQKHFLGGKNIFGK